MDSSRNPINVARFQGVLLDRRAAELGRVDERALAERRLESIPEAELCTNCQELKEERLDTGSPATL